MWRYIGASVPGTSHLTRGVPCQDAHAVGASPIKVNEVFWAVIADGAGSAPCAERGAQVACESIARRISRWFSIHRGVETALDEDVVAQWIEGTRSKLCRLAAHEGRLVRDFACTLVGIAIAPTHAACFQIGDGAIVIRNEHHEYQVVFWPANGEYVNTTFFLTDEAYRQRLEVRILSYVPKEIALLTDGLQRLALHLASRQVHVPFFLPMFRQLRKEMSGRATLLEFHLRRFLGSTAVNQRTDDDRTLVLATRDPMLE